MSRFLRSRGILVFVLLVAAAVAFGGHISGIYRAHVNVDLALAHAQGAGTASIMAEDLVKALSYIDRLGVGTDRVDNLVAIRDKAFTLVAKGDGNSAEYSSMMTNLRLALAYNQVDAAWIVALTGWWGIISLLFLLGAGLLHKYGDRLLERNERRRPRPNPFLRDQSDPRTA